jgi:hypothetical protein
LKLGIVVVYLFGAEQEPLFDLHLRQIEECTQVPYVIYCSVNRLDPKYRQRLAEYPQVRAYELPPTELRRMHEHSYYLDQLIQIAVDDGATHIAIVHLDSFPIRDGWIEALIGTLSASVVFATIAGINTACLVFHRDFYVKYRPTLLVLGAEHNSAEYKKYLQEVAPIIHSGIGYGFKAYQEGLSWYYMRVTSRHAESDGPAIYDDLVFHLQGAVRLSDGPFPTIPKLVRRIGYARFESFQRALHRITPTALRLLLRTKFRRSMELLVDQTRIGWQYGNMAAARDRLLQDPASYIEHLRGNS